MFSATFKESALTLFNNHFLTDQDNRVSAYAHFLNRYDSYTKQQEVSDDLPSMMIGEFRSDTSSMQSETAEPIDRINMLAELSVPSGRN